MTNYQVKLTDGQTFAMKADMAEASASISANFFDADNDADWCGTPFQTADAHHSAFKAATLVAGYFAEDDDDCVEVRIVE